VKQLVDNGIDCGMNWVNGNLAAFRAESLDEGVVVFDKCFGDIRRTELRDDTEPQLTIETTAPTLRHRTTRNERC